MPGDRDAKGDGADDRGPQIRVVGGDGLSDLGLVAGDIGAPDTGGLGIGQHRAQEGQRRGRLVRQPTDEPSQDLTSGPGAATCPWPATPTASLTCSRPTR